MGSNGNRLILRGSHKFRSNHCMWVASPRLLVRMGHQTKTTLVPAQPPNRQPKPTNITQHACTTCLQHSIQPIKLSNDKQNDYDLLDTVLFAYVSNVHILQSFKIVDHLPLFCVCTSVLSAETLNRNQHCTLHLSWCIHMAVTILMVDL